MGNEVRTDPLEIHVADSVLDATGRDHEALSGPDCTHAHAVPSLYRTGIGCLRFCYVPADSRTPRRYRCESVHRPRLTSTRYGTPGYAQLAPGCRPEIARGAEDGAEKGAFHDLFQPQREDNLRARLDEFLPAGMAAGIVFVH